MTNWWIGNRAVSNASAEIDGAEAVVSLFSGLAPLWRFFPRPARAFVGACDQKVVQFLATLDRCSEPAWLEATTCPGLGRIAGIAVFRCDRPRPTASTELDGLSAAASEPRKLGELCFELAATLGHFCANCGLDLALQVLQLGDRHSLEGHNGFISIERRSDLRHGTLVARG